VIAIDLICEVCGTSNPPGTEFCSNCNSYLAWDRSVMTKPAGQPSTTSPTPNPSPQPPNKEWTVQAPAGGSQSRDQGGLAGGGGRTAPTREQSAYSEVSCPSCGTINPGTRRFCSHCGYQFFYSDPGPDAGHGYMPPGSKAARDRAARKAYRRSLPPLYRWRRVIIVAVLMALGLAAGLTLGRDPVGIVKDGWYSLTRKYEWVEGVRATVKPPKTTAAKSDPAALVDRTKKEWTMNWTPRSVSDCEAPVGTGVVVLTLPAPARIRLIQVAPGLEPSNPQHDLQAVPTRLGIKFDGGKCHPADLNNEDGQQEIFIDSEKPVTQVEICIAEAKSSPNAKPLISLTEVILKTYPS
jgi:hypothetical protein